jgi:hypothetical protein
MFWPGAQPASLPRRSGFLLRLRCCPAGAGQQRKRPVVAAEHQRLAGALHLGHQDGGTLVRTTYGRPDERLARDRIREAYRDRPAVPIGKAS